MKKGHYTIIILAVGLVLFSGLLSIKDNRKRKIVVYNGNNLLINIDGKVSTNLPTNGNYYLVDYSCDSNNTKVSWNHMNYDLEVSNSKDGGSVYCNLTFKSNPTLSEMPVGSYVDYIGTGGMVGSSNVSCQIGGAASNSDGSVDTESPNSCKGQNAREDLDNSGYTYGYCNSSNYKYITTGWRLAYVDNGNPVIISAGSPECNIRPSSTNNINYINLANTRALKYCNSEYVYGECTCLDSDSDGLCDGPSTDAWALNENDFHLMIKQNVNKSNVYLYANSSDGGISCGNLESSEECGYNNDLFDNGGYYWFADNYVNSTGINWVASQRKIDETDSTASMGLRPMINLKRNIVVVGGSGTMNDPYQLSTKPLVDIVGNIMAKSAKSDANIDFSKTSEQSSTNGIYVRSDTIDDTYPIYYYRGNVDDNNLIFAGFCWKIVRTTETGGIKLIYNGIPNEEKCNNTGEATQIGTSAFNTNYNSLAYFGYMYGTVYEVNYKGMGNEIEYIYGKAVSYDVDTGQYTLLNTMTSGVWSDIYNGELNNYHYTCFTNELTCENVFYIYNTTASLAYYISLTNGKKIENAINEMLNYNTISSTIKGSGTTEGITLDYWYHTNIENTQHETYLEDTVWCNDRSLYSLGGWDPKNGITNLEDSSTSAFILSPYARLVLEKVPKLICNRNIDKFTVDEKNGNGNLDYSVGLLTIDEMMLAGGGLTSNSSYYLFNGELYWGMSPLEFKQTFSHAITINSNGYTKGYYTNQSYGIRPSISLKEGTRVSSNGDGTGDNPYVVVDMVDINKDKVTINFDLNGGETINFASKDVVIGARYGNLATPTKTGHTFVGWYTEQNFVELVTSESRVNVSENQTLYAKWKANTYTVTFDLGSYEGDDVLGTVSPSSKSVTNGQVYGELPAISGSFEVSSSSDYESCSVDGFKGWYTEETGGTQITEDTVVSVSANQTLYAQWNNAVCQGQGDSGDTGDTE